MRCLDLPLQLHHLPNALYQSVCLLRHGPFYYCLSFVKLLWNQHGLQLFEIHDSELASNLRPQLCNIHQTRAKCTLRILPAIHCQHLGTNALPSSLHAQSELSLTQPASGGNH
ncbi:hypothetical protein QL285_034929 [Trifolium repens]|nr:hypothetical protein QL285_034929 [Trifolium repens]